MTVAYKIVGKSKINGVIRVSGSKNFSVKALAAALLCKGVSLFENIPNNNDVHKTLRMLQSLGVSCSFDAVKKHCLIDTHHLSNTLFDKDNANMTTFLIASALLRHFDEIAFPKRKGCFLGDRLSDFHLQAFQVFGVKCYFEEDFLFLKKKASFLNGCDFVLPFPSVGATETCLFLGAIAKGVSVIDNIAIEPEVQALIALLVEMGVSIIFEDDRKIKIIGGCDLHPIKCGYIHGDYIEVATWAILAAMNDGNIVVEGITPELIGSFLSVYSILGGGYQRLGVDSISFFKKSPTVKSVAFETGVFPMLRTDLQPLIAAMATTQSGLQVVIHETIYNNRLDYVEDFNLFGGNLVAFQECLGNQCKYSSRYWHSVVIQGRSDFFGVSSVLAKTVRSGMANILMATVAEGVSEIRGVECVERGYCSLCQKLQSVGVNIQRMEV